MIFNCDTIPDLDLLSSYLKQLEYDNYLISLMEIKKMSSTRLDMVDLPPVIKKVKRLINELGTLLDIREDDIIRLDANMMNCVEIRFSARKDIKVNLYVEREEPGVEGIDEVMFDVDEMYFSYIHNRRRRIMHGTMSQMIMELKTILNETQIPKTFDPQA